MNGKLSLRGCNKMRDAGHRSWIAKDYKDPEGGKLMKSSITRALGAALTISFCTRRFRRDGAQFASFVPAKYVLHEPIFQKLADDIDREITVG